MQAQNIVLASNASATTAPVPWRGGRAALLITATGYGSTVSLQVQHIDGTWVTLNGTTFSANGLSTYDAPAGSYRIFCSGGTTTALYATLNLIPYG